MSILAPRPQPRMPLQGLRMRSWLSGRMASRQRDSLAVVGAHDRKEAVYRHVDLFERLRCFLGFTDGAQHNDGCTWMHPLGNRTGT